MVHEEHDRRELLEVGHTPFHRPLLGVARSLTVAALFARIEPRA
jgi:hypothetical protein